MREDMEAAFPLLDDPRSSCSLPGVVGLDTESGLEKAASVLGIEEGKSTIRDTLAAYRTYSIWRASQCSPIAGCARLRQSSAILMRHQQGNTNAPIGSMQGHLASIRIFPDSF